VRGWKMMQIVPQIFIAYLLDPFLLWLATIALTMIGLAKVYRWRKRLGDAKTDKWIVLMVFAPIITTILFFSIYNGIVNGMQRPSRIDVAQFAELTYEQVSRVDEVLEEVMLSVFGRTPSMSGAATNRTYNSTVSGRDGSASLWVRAYAYETYDRAARRIQSSIRSRGRYTDHVNDNNTEIVLFRPYMDTSYGLPSRERITVSHIRIGHVAIQLIERHIWVNGRAYLSEHFITTLVETLQYNFD